MYAAYIYFARGAVMAEKKVRAQVYLPQNAHQKLKQRAEAEGITMATQIREALAAYVVDTPAKEGNVLSADDPIWQLVGVAEGGPADGALHHDDLSRNCGRRLPLTSALCGPAFSFGRSGKASGTGP